MLGISIRYEQPCFRSVYEAMQEIGVSSEDNDGTAILIWHDSLRECDYFSHLAPWQIVNRLPCISALCRKAPFAYLLQRMQKLIPSIYTFMPKTFILPAQYQEFKNAVELGDKTYIYKPDSSSQGSGIIIFKPKSEITIKEDSNLAVVQEYINSYLINNTKFDLRLYVLVASLNPLEIYVYRNGLARFCSEEITTDSKFGQLSNVTINQANPNADISEVSQLVSDIAQQIEKDGISMKELWQRIDNAIVLTIIAAHKTLSEAEKWYCPNLGYPRCFQILGFDILLDKNFDPWIMEVNRRPSLDYYRGKERRMKVGMIRDAVKIACPMEQAQIAINSRKWAWEKSSWTNFVKMTPSITAGVAEARDDVLQNSLFERAYPNPENPNSRNWEIARKVGDLLPIENMPGFNLADQPG